ncbi:nuclear cap binding complex subunit [Tilletia horrida]|uniref:Nuclear cap-binding protein subunit 2 n=1 Tax=Tilletia horrida TaxID=155126 RepID=A0AAN6JMS1_9BASI|nr:nuclear cap binding complex subunit [Tilletia horrida]KAK0536198.1 nuclear cap binding complex subunit [Tilletia horrida]KAK0539729.1 nuclear cap binding complex subunit [Tilletia horrida]KAK0566549.1 nuclear cap binding complex subunit [Tilletia horrida]
MAHVVSPLDAPSTYRDGRSAIDAVARAQALSQTSTLYVGNLSFYTTEEQMYELFSRVADRSGGGGVRRIIMGLDRNQKTPCGFAFVEYYTHAEAVDCMRYISGTKLDERVIRCDLDPGYTDGRQYGRGQSGGQVRDEYRQDYDAGRGGWGHNRLREEEERKRQEELERERARRAGETYRDDHVGGAVRIVPQGAEGQYDEQEGAARDGHVVVGAGGGEEASRKRERSEDDEEEERSKSRRFEE